MKVEPVVSSGNVESTKSVQTRGRENLLPQQRSQGNSGVRRALGLFSRIRVRRKDVNEQYT
ncbi:MAG TPA: hypothetical protein VK572_10520, partial [Burkholderiales bacterium]|nr:hypothetical protein [Burkholderiales bacterium]